MLAGLDELERTTHANRGIAAELRARSSTLRAQLVHLAQVRRQLTDAERRAGAALAASERAAASPSPAAPGTRTLVVDAVAYHLPGRTASGLPVGVGVIAVDPRVIPLGTRVFVPGYGPAVAADVGSAVKGNIIDLWMPSTE